VNSARSVNEQTSLQADRLARIVPIPVIARWSREPLDDAETYRFPSRPNTSLQAGPLDDGTSIGTVIVLAFRPLWPAGDLSHLSIASTPRIVVQ
jgi:hypothetical protein